MSGLIVIAISIEPSIRKYMVEKITAEEFDDDGKAIISETSGEDGKSQPSKISSDNPVIEPDENDEPQVPVRKSVQQHIIARQKDTIEKLRSKEKDKTYEDDEPLGDEEEITPEASSLVAREVQKAVSPLIESLANQADERELDELFESEPDAAKMSRQIRAYMKHPEYKGVPPEVIYHHLAFDKALGGAVQKKSNAKREAGHYKSAGTSRRAVDNDNGGIPDVSDMDDKDFEALQHKARTGQFLK